MTRKAGGSLLLAGMVAAGAFAAGAAQIVSGGKPAAAVVLEEKAGANRQLAYAAQELTNWVGKISGAALPIVNAPAKSPLKTKIVLGTPETSKAVATFAKKNAADFKKLVDSDGFIIAEEGGKTVYIAAKKTKGVLNGVYRFLERNSDIIWVRQLHAEDGCGTIYGSWPNLENKIERLVDVPSLVETRHWTCRTPGQEIWAARLLCNSRMHYPECAKNYLNDTTDANVVLWMGIVNGYKETNPEIFPLVKGKRDTGEDHHLCFMNPKTAELFIREAEKIVGKSSENVHHAVIGLGDHHNVCTCDLCTTPIDCGGGKVVKPSDSNFRATQYALFVNKVSDALCARFPRMKPIRMFSYIFTAEGPGVPVKGGVDRYCPYVKNHKKPVFDDEVNAVWHQKAESFVKAGMPIYGLYEYYLCHTTPQFYHAISEVAQQDLKYYLARGLRDCYLDAGGDDGTDTKIWYNNNKVFDISAIEFWVMARLMWNVDADVAGLRREYCRRAYREAGEVMYGYFEKLAKNYNADSAGCFWNDDPEAAAKYYVVEKGLAGWVRETLAKAEAAAKHPGSKELIRRHRVRMEELVAKAEKSPKKVTHVVPQVTGRKPDIQPKGDYWKDVPPIAPLTKVSSQKPPSGNVELKVTHDRENLYVLFSSRREGDLKRFREAKAKGLVGKPLGKGESFPWGSEPPIEFYFDGKLGPKGSYYMFAAAVTEVKTMFWGSAEPQEPFDWSVKFEEIDGALVGLLRFSLIDMGVDISKGNKIHAMFLASGDAWNGGQWHAPTSFQTLMLEMK